MPRIHLSKALLFLSRDLPRWLFLGALIYAPWDYGGTTSRSITAINWILGAVVGLWLLGLSVRRRRPVIPVQLWVAAAAILVLGWFTTYNARAIYDSDFGMFVPMRNPIPWAPSSVDAIVATTSMVRVTCLIGVLFFVVDLCRRPQWLLRIWITIAIAGGSIALLGLLQRATGAVLPYWEYRPWLDHFTFFATYYYHGNAGAFLNLVFPPTVGLALRTFQRPRVHIQRAIWLTATFLLIVAIFTNTSRAAQLLGIILFVTLSLAAVRQMRRLTVAQNRIAIAATVGVTVVVLVAIAQATGITRGVERWHRTAGEIPADSRWQAYKIALSALPDAGWFGFGPGTFVAIFPHYERAMNVELQGRMTYLHQDYLQTLLEWGWLGGACWAFIFGGGIASAVTALRRARDLKPQPRLYRLLPLVLIALGAVLLHSSVDFPLQIASLQLYVATYLGICWAGKYAFAHAEKSHLAGSRPK
ncbi:MAG: O-antigen ligase family protein [Chthoniobacterales bacterium]